MNEHDLDAAIDDVAREMTAGDLDGAFRARVVGRIESQFKVRGSRFGVLGSRFVVLGSGFAAAAMIVAAVVMFRDPHQRAITESPIAHAPAAPAAPAGTWRPALAGPAVLVRRSVRLKPDATYEASQVEALAPPPLDVPSIALAELPAPESIQLDQLQTISSIAVAPLAAGDQGERR